MAKKVQPITRSVQARIVGTEAPSLLAAQTEPLRIVRSFAFMDLCSFTKYTDEHGPIAAREILLGFRAAVRDVTERRGVRIAKWLGDGVMVVGVDAGTLASTAVDIVNRIHTSELDVRGGLSTGPVLFVDGDDYVGRAINLAARLCDIAEAGEVIADGDSCQELPGWIVSEQYKNVRVKGLGNRSDLLRLGVLEGYRAPLWELPG